MNDRLCRRLISWLMMVPTLSACSVPMKSTGPFEPSQKSLTFDLTFPHHSALLSRSDLAKLQKSLPRDITRWRCSLISAPDESLPRAEAVAQVIGVKVRAYVPRPPDHLSAGVAKLVITRSFTRIASCGGPPVHIQNELWPMTRTSGLTLMPAGCTVNRDLDMMLTRSDDAFRGRQSTPTPVQPFIEAARRYETRNLTKLPYGQNFANGHSQFNAESSPMNGLTHSSPAALSPGSTAGASAPQPTSAPQTP